MDLLKIQANLEALNRHLDEIRHSAAFQIASDDQFVRSLFMAPAKMAEHRRERDRHLVRRDRLKERLELQEDALLSAAVSEGLVNGKNATVRARQERQILAEATGWTTSQQRMRDVESDIREAETLYEQSRHELHVSLAILRDASAKLEWLGWLA